MRFNSVVIINKFVVLNLLVNIENNSKSIYDSILVKVFKCHYNSNSYNLLAITLQFINKNHVEYNLFCQHLLEISYLLQFDSTNCFYFLQM